MKHATIVKVTGPQSATFTVTNDDGSTYTVENYSPLPVDDSVACAAAIARYDAAYKAALAAPAPVIPGAGVPVVDGTVLTPTQG